jgi:L-lactate dehydrogenase complex protein LldG
MKSRHEILTRLQKRAREETHPFTWQSRRQYGNLADRFAVALTEAKGEVVRASTSEEALTRMGNLLSKLGAQRVVANGEPPLTSVDLPARWPEIEWYVVEQTPHGHSEQTPDDLREFCASADVGLSGADAALAETGSVVFVSGPERSRLASLLPSIHIALVSTSCLTPDIFTWTAARKGPSPSALTLVSGPSKTADIEQTLAVGVHGPRRFIVILYDE